MIIEETIISVKQKKHEQLLNHDFNYLRKNSFMYLDDCLAVGVSVSQVGLLSDPM